MAQGFPPHRQYAIVDRVALAEGVEKLARLHAEPVEPSKVVPLRASQG
jgi:hypothetical protein